MKKVLLTTVCGPFGANTDDCTEHVMPELFHAQVTRSQGIFSLRSTYVSYGLELIAQNIKTPTTVLQYPTMKQFKRELKKGYDYVGISFVMATFEKLKKMARAVREVSPRSKIVLGGYGTVLPECEEYGDYICREEGVAFMRQLLGETHDDSPLKHVVYPTSSKLMGFLVTKGAALLAGLGCPHGCDFCCTSHFFGRRHIPLLKTGEDIYREIRRVQKDQGDPKLGIGVIEEDFLMQRKRAGEYLECVKKDTEDPPRISCFASAYSISLWDPKDLVRMGIETIWIGVESREATYAKLQGCDLKKTFDTLHSHGINTLASLIIGHDFHTVEKVWDDFEYLMSLEPTLSQFLILSLACNTPLFERLKKEGRLLDVPYPHYDGFHLVFRHPHIGKEKMEQLLIDIYDEEYRRLGPSAIRYIERQAAGYLRFKDSPELLLRLRAEQRRDACLEALPLFPTAVRYAPTREVAEKVRNIEESIVREIGGASLKNRIAAMVLPALACVSDFRHKYCAYSQPKLARTEYRMSPRMLVPVDLLGEGTLKIRLKEGLEDRYHLMVELHGVFDRVTAVKLKKRIEAYLKEHTGKLALNFHGVTEIERDALLRFFKKLRGYRERIKIVNVDSLSAEVADVIAYARNYFEVSVEEECLAKSTA